jgi:hypothetical protein
MWGIAEFAPANSLVNPVGTVTLTEITPYLKKTITKKRAETSIFYTDIVYLLYM